MKKFVCKCGNTWFADEDDDENLCSNSYFDESNFKHTVKESKKFTADDYAQLWSDGLEDANRHSLTDMPNEILSVIEKCVIDKKTTTSIMKKLYEKEIGI